MNNETDNEVEVDQNDVIQITPEEENTRPTPVISVAKIRPFPTVSQTTPQVRRSQKQKNTLGRTRILTDTPETRLILEDHQRQLEKIVKVRKRLQTTSQPKKTSKTAAKNKKDAGNSDSDSWFVAPSSRCTSKNNAKKKKEETEKESEDIESEDEKTENAVVIKTRTGRIVKRRIQ